MSHLRNIQPRIEKLTNPLLTVQFPTFKSENIKRIRNFGAKKESTKFQSIVEVRSNQANIVFKNEIEKRYQFTQFLYAICILYVK